jgi:CheY-like chemotaxis protein
MNGDRATLLIVDDNADMRAHLIGVLAKWWDVEAVSDGKAALDLARQCKPDLILSDAMMPGLDGTELLAALRCDPDLREVPVILVSARAGEAARIEEVDAGADDYLVKPFSSRSPRASWSQGSNPTFRCPGFAKTSLRP